MKKGFILSLIAVISTPVLAQIQYDTLSVQQIGEGVFYYEIEAPSVPWTIDLVEIDLTASSITMETVKAQDQFGGYERTSEMALRKSYEGHEVIAAVNGDFYGGGNPTNAQVVKGEIIKGPISRDVFGYTREKKVFINPTNYQGILYSDSTQYEIMGVNQTRTTDAMIYYNHFLGSSTGTNQYGTELIMKALDPWVVNGMVRAVVLSKSSAGDAPLTDSTFVLSGHGTSKTILDGFAAGDTLSIQHQLLPGPENVKEVVGGRGKFLDDGVNKGDWPERHPRTAVGFNADSTKLYLMTVDGRQSSSAGMTLTEMGNFMATFGVANALNLDGGGSTSMVVHHEVVNDPSDGSGERAVANALMVVSSAEKLGVLEHLNLSPSYAKVYRGKSIAFQANGTDANYFPVQLDSSLMQFSLSEGFGGSVSADGRYMAGETPDTGYVILDYNGIRDSALVVIKGIADFNIYPRFMVADSLQQFSYYNESFDIDGVSQTVPAADISWIVSDPALGSITSEGSFKGIDNGTTSVIASFDGLSDTVDVEVQIGTGISELDGFEDASLWSVSGNNLDLQNTAVSLSDSFKTEGSYSLKLHYEFVYDNNPDVWAYLEQDKTIFGIPSSIDLKAKSDGKKHLFELLFHDNNGEEYTVRVKKWVENTAFDDYPALMSDLGPIDPFSTFYYPITLKRVGIKLASEQQQGVRYTGNIYLDDMNIKYPVTVGVSNERESQTEIPEKMELEQNYPNPFNPQTQISFSIPRPAKVGLDVYDVLGRKVLRLINKRMSAGAYTIPFEAGQLSSGIYIYTLTAGDSQLSKKMTLIK